MGQTFSHRFRVNAAVEDGQLLVYLAPAFAEEGFDLSLQLLRREEPDHAQVVEFGPAVRMFRRGLQPVGAVKG